MQLLVNLLQHPSLQKSSKSWYLLKVQILQELSMFLRLPPSILLPDLYKQLCSHGNVIYRFIAELTIDRMFIPVCKFTLRYLGWVSLSKGRFQVS